MKKPLLFYVISIFLGCLTVLISVNSFVLGAVIAASFLVTIYLTCDKNYILLIFLFFVIGIINYFCYFNPKITSDRYVSIRILNRDNYHVEGSFNGRKIILSGNLDKVSVGDRIYSKGIFTAEPDYEKGIAGTYKLMDIKLRKKDIFYQLIQFKEEIYLKFSKEIGDRKAATLVAVCFGDVSYLQKDQKDELNRLGIVHIVSVSGTHMVIIYKVLDIIGGYQFSILMSLLYVIFTGSQASTVRAFIMIAILKLSKKFYKKYDKLSALALSAMILLLWKPYYISDLGFILSYLSVLGIIIFNDRFKKIFYYLPKYINEGISLSLSAQSFSSPYALFYFKSFGSGFLLGNIFLLPLYSILVILGNLSLFFINMDYIFKFINYIILQVMTAIDGGIYIVLNISPPILYFSYAEVTALLILYILYMLHGKMGRHFLYLPLFILLIGFYDNYKIFPEIHYMKIYNNIGIIIKYKEKSILCMEKIPPALKDTVKAKAAYRVKDVMLLPKEGASMRIGNERFIRILNCFDREKRRSVNLEIVTPKGKTIVGLERPIEDSPNPFHYDIIYLKNDSGKKSYEINKEIALLMIFFNRVYEIS